MAEGPSNKKLPESEDGSDKAMDVTVSSSCDECSEVCDDYSDHGNVATLHIDAKVMCATQADETGQKQRSGYIEQIVKHVCAFRNSRGGILLIHVQNHANSNWYHGWFDKWLDRWLNDLIEDGSLFREIYKKSWEPLLDQNHHRGFLAINVKRSVIISTVKYNTYFQTDHEVTQMKSSNIIKFFKDKRIFKSDEPQLRGNPAENIYESCEVQFKHLESKNTISPKNLKKMVWSVDHSHLSKYISAFSKNENGGTFYFGVRENVIENMAVIEKSGFNFEKENQTSSQELDKFPSNLEGSLSNSLRVFNYEGKRISKGIVKVALNDADIPGNKILEVAVAPVSGIVFTKKPESYYWDQEVLDYEEEVWIKHMAEGANP